MQDDFSVDKPVSPGQNSRGLVCRKCGCGHFRVIYTRRAAGNRLVRRRECRHCGKRFSTWEQEVGEYRE
jgi:hypothetical protein